MYLHHHFNKIPSCFYHFLNNFYFISFLQSNSPLSSIHQVSIPPLALLGSISTALLKTPRWETSTGILMKVWAKGSSIGAEYCSHWLWRFIPPLQLWQRRVKPLQMWKAKWASLLLNARVEGPRRRRQAKKVVSKCFNHVWWSGAKINLFIHASWNGLNLTTFA